MFFNSDNFMQTGKDKWSANIGAWEVEIRRSRTDEGRAKMHWYIYMHTPLCQRVIIDSSERGNNWNHGFDDAVHDAREALDLILSAFRNEGEIMDPDGWSVEREEITPSTRPIKYND